MKKVLIVDDALELGRLLQTVFLTLDASLSTQVVPSAEEALLESTRSQLDLLVSDIRLPGMSGFDLVRKIRARHPELKVMMMTGMIDPAVAERAREVKVDGFFTKPLDMAEFIAVARRCLGMPGETPSAPASNGSRLFTASGGAAPATLSGLVSDLRQRLGAQAVYVLDTQGKVVVNAGDSAALPQGEEWNAQLQSALKAGLALARSLGGEAGEHAVALPGKNIRLVLAPVGEFALLVVLGLAKSGLRMALAVEETLEVQRELAAALAGLGVQAAPPPVVVQVPSQAAQPPARVTAPLTPPPQTAALTRPEPAPEAGLDKLEALLKQSMEQLKVKDIDSFWEEAAAASTARPTNPDILTYDQAVKLGLAPKQE